MHRRYFLKSGAIALVTMELSPSFLRRTAIGMQLPAAQKPSPSSIRLETNWIHQPETCRIVNDDAGFQAPPKTKSKLITAASPTKYFLE